MIAELLALLAVRDRAERQSGSSHSPLWLGVFVILAAASFAVIA
jgi:hypothetical protein